MRGGPNLPQIANLITALMCMHQPGIEPGSVPWQGTILPLDHWCLLFSFLYTNYLYFNLNLFFRQTLIKTLVVQKSIWLQLLKPVGSIQLSSVCPY